ncbi:UNVERIFIED_CONTAM: hypothetical protein GTU68_063418 [Idotea baltica]|nr:hypothetical protein [Idotea baltica]
MTAAGMKTREDAIGNVIGRYDAANGAEDAPAIMLGSHLDTVINAGRYDGMLGVLCALAVVESLNENNIRLPYAVEVIGFADEEGVRYQSTYLGSRAITGHFDSAVLSRRDDTGVVFSDALQQFGSNIDDLPKAIRKPGDIHAYLELHIEQGPVLEKEQQAVGVVSSIAGANRMTVNLTGLAGHAGTVPMNLRQDALVAAAECISLVEALCSDQDALVGTVGRIDAKPGAGNVIAGDVEFSIDIRAAQDNVRQDRVARVVEGMQSLCKQRNIEINIEHVHEAESVDCDAGIMHSMQTALESAKLTPLTLPSGAGHDAAAMAEMTKMGMLFVRCAGGISHHPDESVTEPDAIVGAQILLSTVLNLCQAPD